MNRCTPTVEDRLAGYRSTLDRAISDRATQSSPESLIVDDEFGWDRGEVELSSGRSLALVGASAVLLIGGLAVVASLRDDTRAQMPAASSFDTVVDRSGTSVADVIVDTSLARAAQGPGSTPDCSIGSDTVGTGTLYLGGPASDQNLASKGFIFSLPEGPPPVEVALQAIALAVIGQECGISAAATAAPGIVIVTVNPPAVPVSLRLDVDIDEQDGVTGVTGLIGHTMFELNRIGNQATLALRAGVPASATRAQIRFKKGDDVWELSADPKSGSAIDLAVPAGDIDRFPNEPIDWVLFTLIDVNGHVVDAGGGQLSRLPD